MSRASPHTTMSFMPIDRDLHRLASWIATSKNRSPSASILQVTLHCKVNAQKKVQARDGARLCTRPAAGRSSVTFAASRTTCSSVDRYSSSACGRKP